MRQEGLEKTWEEKKKGDFSKKIILDDPHGENRKRKEDRRGNSELTKCVSENTREYQKKAAQRET
jgi:hypothetical protein